MGTFPTNSKNGVVAQHEAGIPTASHLILVYLASSTKEKRTSAYFVVGPSNPTQYQLLLFYRKKGNTSFLSNCPSNLTKSFKDSSNLLDSQNSIRFAPLPPLHTSPVCWCVARPAPSVLSDRGADGDHDAHGVAAGERRLAAVGVGDPNPRAPQRLLAAVRGGGRWRTGGTTGRCGGSWRLARGGQHRCGAG